MNHMIYVSKNKRIVFDSFADVKKEYGSYWAEICQSCYEKYSTILEGKLDTGAAQGICSVKNCMNTADHYVDFKEEEVSIESARLIDDEKLQELIMDFNKKLTDAQVARKEIMNHLEEQYGIDTINYAAELEDPCDWCYGINNEAVELLIKRE